MPDVRGDTAALLRPHERLVILVGAYGSGKTEVAVNLALQLAHAGHTVQLADLDLVNPYFRSREARRVMEQAGVRVVIPPGAQAFADLPIVVPEVMGLLRPAAGTVSLLDVGGDDVGARVLSSFRPLLTEGAYELWQVVNGNRPFTATVDGCLTQLRSLEQASRLAVTGLIGNTHLTDETSVETVRHGNALIADVARAAGVAVRAVAALTSIADRLDADELPAPLLRLERHMLPPWLTRSRVDAGGDTGAGRPMPIGVPPPLAIPESQGEPDGSHRD